MPCRIDDQELPIAYAISLAAFHGVANIGAEIVVYPHRRIGRSADDRIAVRIRITFVYQAVRKPGAPCDVKRKDMFSARTLHHIVADNYSGHCSETNPHASSTTRR